MGLLNIKFDASEYHRVCMCGDTFYTEEALNIHLEREHKQPPEQEGYKCESCERVFATIRGRIIHQRVHTAPGARSPVKPRKEPYNTIAVCEICGKRYGSRATLIYHQRVHIGERPHNSNMWPPDDLNEPVIMQNHIRTYTGDDIFQCPRCHKTFGSEADLIRHDRVHTAVKPNLGRPTHVKRLERFSQSKSMKLNMKELTTKILAERQARERFDMDEGEVGVEMELDVGSEVTVRSQLTVMDVATLEMEASEFDGTYHMYFDYYTIEDSHQLGREVEIGPLKDDAERSGVFSSSK